MLQALDDNVTGMAERKAGYAPAADSLGFGASGFGTYDKAALQQQGEGDTHWSEARGSYRPHPIATRTIYTGGRRSIVG